MKSTALAIILFLTCGTSKLVASATYLRQGTNFDEENDEALTEYLHEILEGFRIAMPLGVAELNIPILEPAFIEQRTLDYNSDGTRFSIFFSNVTIVGISEFEVDRLTVRIKQLETTIRVRFPVLYGEGHYHLRGVAYRILPLKGHGPWWLELHNFTLDLTLQGELTEKRQFQLRRLALFGDVHEVRSHIANLLDSGENLSQIVNAILRKNGRRILREITTRLRKTLEDVMAPYVGLLDSNVILEFAGENATYRTI